MREILMHVCIVGHIISKNKCEQTSFAYLLVEYTYSLGYPLKLSSSNMRFPE